MNQVWSRGDGGHHRSLFLIGGIFTVLILVGGFYRFGLTGQGLLALPTVAVLAVAAILDIQRKVIPDWVTLPGAVWVLATSTYLGLSRAAEALLGAVLCGGGLLVLALVSRGGIGGGDVKLMALIGAFLGWRWGFIALFCAQLAAALPAAYLLVTGRKGRKHPLAFGPFLSTFAILAAFIKPA